MVREFILKEKIAKTEWICFFITVVTGGFIYYQMPSNWLANPDAVWNAMYFRNGHGGEKVNGRILQIVVDKLRMNMITPVLTTMMCIALLAVTALLISRIIENQHMIIQLIIGQLLLFMPCTSSALTYYYCSDSFMIALLCVTLGVYCVKQYRVWQSYIIATGLFFISLYLYQAYICVVFSFAVIILLMDTLRGENIQKSLKLFATYVVTSVVAVGAYVVSFKVIQVLLHIEARTDRGFGFDSMVQWKELVSLIVDAYINCYEYFFGNRLLNNEFGDRSIINLLVIIVGLLLGSVLFIKGKIWKDWRKSIIVILCILALPIALEAISIMSPNVDEYGATGIIMIPTMMCVYILVITLGKEVAQLCNKAWIQGISCGVVVLFLRNSIVFTSLCINSMYLQLNKAQTVADIMIEQIVEQYGYEPTRKLLVAGSMEDGNFPHLYEWPTEAIQGTSASYGFMWDTYTGNECCWIQFLKQYKGLNFQEIGQEVYKEILEKPIYQEMPLFPNEGSVVMIEDTIVVKMSDIELE